MKLRYTTEELKNWIKKGEAISPHIAIDLTEENEKLRKLLFEAIDIVEGEDFLLLKKMDKEALRLWKDKSVNFLQLRV